MAFYTLFSVVLALFLLQKHCDCFNPKLLNTSLADGSYGWYSAVATWYGDANGAGTTGGACSYGDAVEHPPYSSMVSAGSPSLYQNGEGCGVCYEVKCSTSEACSGEAITVTITDLCPGCENDHFDFSGAAFGAMAKSGLASQLRNAGTFQVQFRMVKCKYPGVNVVVDVDQGSNPYYFAAAIKYVDGTGLSKVEIQQQSGGWMRMRESNGATYALDNFGSLLKPPFSLRLTDKQTGQTLTLQNVVPLGWQPGHTYRSLVNFDKSY